MNTAQGIEEEPSSKEPPTILVVDDVVLARMVAASQLRHHGFAVIEVSSAEEAMRVLNAAVKVDLVFADINLEGSSLDGYELVRWVRDNKPGTKLLSPPAWCAHPAPTVTPFCPNPTSMKSCCAAFALCWHPTGDYPAASPAGALRETDAIAM